MRILSWIGLVLFAVIVSFLTAAALLGFELHQLSVSGTGIENLLKLIGVTLFGSLVSLGSISFVRNDIRTSNHVENVLNLTSPTTISNDYVELSHSIKELNHETVRLSEELRRLAEMPSGIRIGFESLAKDMERIRKSVGPIDADGTRNNDSR